MTGCLPQDPTMAHSVTLVNTRTPLRALTGNTLLAVPPGNLTTDDRNKPSWRPENLEQRIQIKPVVGTPRGSGATDLFANARQTGGLPSTVYGLQPTDSQEGSLMKILVATDGSIDVDETARFAYALAGPDGTTTVATIVSIPRQLVSELREQWGEPEPIAVDSDAEYVGAPESGGAMRRGYPGDDAVVDQYLGNKRVDACRPVREAIRALGGKADSQAREGTDITAGIMEMAEELGADAIVIGSHGHGSFQGLLGSTGAKLVRRAKRPVLVLR